MQVNTIPLRESYSLIADGAAYPPVGGNRHNTFLLWSKSGRAECIGYEMVHSLTVILVLPTEDPTLC